jgi:hypothetical protein
LKDTLNEKVPRAGTFRAGATGLQPATSGVTGQFEGREVDDGGHEITLFMRPFRTIPERLARLSGAVPGVCCPTAARDDLSGGLAGAALQGYAAALYTWQTATSTGRVTTVANLLL